MFGFAERLQAQEEGRLNVGLNAAVMTMALMSNPIGWAIEQRYVYAPHTLSELNQNYNNNGRIVVWGGASEDTVFHCPEHNAAFRAWHDRVHYDHQLPFNIAGEAACAYVQVAQLVREYGDDDEVRSYAAVILSEVIGQAMYKARQGEFPQDQASFCAADAPTWEWMAGQLVMHFTSDPEPDDRAVVRFAQSTWGVA